ncbi:uncharacterized protein [Montipora foliosa]|uniref:uncharacterized protein n=1 Tax=Montipora foliosa TaxID=591990 RepID=UPI0035F1D195
MAGFYTVPFQKIAPKTAESSKESNTPLDSFMDVAKCLRAMIFNFMRKQLESCEVFKKGENEELDKQLDDYLTYRKNKTRNKESVGSGGSSVTNKETWENLQHELVVQIQDLQSQLKSERNNHNLVKTSESKLLKNIEGLKNELKDERKTTSKLRDELKQTLAENQLLKTKLEECARNNERQQMSLNEETERLRAEIQILKRTRVEQYIKPDSEVREGVSLLMEQMTFTDAAANTDDVEDNYQLPEPDEESNLTAANREKKGQGKSSLMGKKVIAANSYMMEALQRGATEFNTLKKWVAKEEVTPFRYEIAINLLKKRQ